VKSSTAADSVKSQMSINDFYQSVQAVFGPCAIYAKQGDKIIRKGWEPEKGEFVSPDWDNVAYEVKRRKGT
jgi:hypothetical protein